MRNKILFGQEAVSEIRKGINITHKAVAATLGAAGKNAFYRSYFSRNPMVTNDGVSIAMMVNLEDEAQAMGADFIKQSALRTNDEAGDGTTTNVILAKAMVDRGFEKIEAGANAMILKREIGEAVQKVVAQIKKRAKPVKNDEELFQVANLSMENSEVAKIVADSVKWVGENGSVIVQESSGTKLVKEEEEGMSFDSGYLSNYVVTDTEKMQAVLENTHVIVTDKMFSVNNDIFPLLNTLFEKGAKHCLLICDSVQGEVLTSFVQNRLKGVFNFVIVKKPDDMDILEDIATVTGAEMLTQDKVPGGLIPLHFNSLGFAKHVVVTAKNTLIFGGAGKREKIDERVKAIKTLIKECDSSHKKEQLKERLARFVGRVVVLKVGAPTEGEMQYLKLKVDDAVAATRAALEEGVVMGGGKTLYEIASAEVPETLGEDVVYYACQQPIRKIIENAGFKPDEIVPFLKDGEVWNAITTKTCKNPLEVGIIDPAKVERCALENAASMAQVLVTVETMFVPVPEKKPSA